MLSQVLIKRQFLHLHMERQRACEGSQGWCNDDLQVWRRRFENSENGWQFRIPVIKIVVALVVVTAVALVLKNIADDKIDQSEANAAEKELAKKDYIAAYKVNQSKNSRGIY